MQCVAEEAIALCVGGIFHGASLMRCVEQCCCVSVVPTLSSVQLRFRRRGQRHLTLATRLYVLEPTARRKGSGALGWMREISMV